MTIENYLETTYSLQRDILQKLLDLINQQVSFEKHLEKKFDALDSAILDIPKK